MPRQWAAEIRRWQCAMRHASGQDFLHNSTRSWPRAVVRNLLAQGAFASSRLPRSSVSQTGPSGGRACRHFPPDPSLPGARICGSANMIAHLERKLTVGCEDPAYSHPALRHRSHHGPVSGGCRPPTHQPLFCRQGAVKKPIHTTPPRDCRRTNAAADTLCDTKSQSR